MDPATIFVALVIISVVVTLFFVFVIYGSAKKADLQTKEKLSPIAKVEQKHKQKPRIKRAPAARIFLIVSVTVIYLLILMPQLIHVNIDAGMVVYNKQTTIESLPKDVQDVCNLRGFNPSTLLLVKHSYPRWTALVISSRAFSNEAIVEMSDYIIDWRVDWRDFNLVDQAFDRLVVAEIKQLGSFESWIEETLSKPFGGYLLDLSLVDFYAGPVWLVLCVTLLVSKRLALWNIPAIWGFYSFQVWMLNRLAFTHNVYVTLEWTYFGYLFLGLFPITIYLWHFERTEAGRNTAEKMKTISKFLGLSK